MRSIANLFGRSPFVPLQAHMEKVAECVEQVTHLFDALERGDTDAIEEGARRVSRIEYEADQLKYDIQSHMPKRLFLPVDRTQLHEILHVQDKIADKAENIAILLTLKKLPIIPGFHKDFLATVDKNIAAFSAVREILQQLDELLETGFGGGEAQRVLNMVDEVAKLEHDADVLQRTLLKNFYAHESELSVGEFDLWSRLFSEVANISDLSERLANRVRRTLELKG